MQRRALIQSAALAAAGLGAGAQTAPPAAASAPRVLRLAIPTPETTLDPVQTNSDQYTSTLLAQILEAPRLAFDYLARPAALVLGTAAAMPEVSADGRVFTVRIRPGILFADDPPSRGGPA